MTDVDQNLRDEIEDLKAQVSTYEAWFRAIDEHAKFDFWFKDSDSNYRYVNPHFAKNMGRDKSQLQDKPISDIFESDRLERVRALDNKIMSEGYLNRVVPCDASGTLEMHEEHRFVVRGDDGNPVGLGCFAFEVTEKSLAEETLQQAEKLANLCSWRWSAETNSLISCSNQLAIFLGVSMTETFELFPKRFEKLVLPEDRSVHEVIRERMNGESQSSYEIEYRLRRKDGNIIYVREKAEPFSTGGSTTEYLGVMQDITEQKMAERALKAVNENLENKVLHRTSELQKAKDAAVKSNEAKTLFLASMSHELKTPLNAIIGFSDLMVTQSLGPLGNEEYIDLSKHILESGDNLSRMIDDVLVVAGTQVENRDTIEFEPLGLTGLIDTSVDKIRADCKNRNIGIIWTGAKQYIELNCNKQRLSRVFDAILSNAVRFNKNNGFIKITVSETSNKSKTGGVFIDIADTGIGISENDLKQIMMPFVQVDNSYTRAYDGTGLGLALAKKWTELHGGKISIISRLNRGTAVRIFLPTALQAHETIDLNTAIHVAQRSA